ncbi:hypothetical protein DXG01_003996 [Tephrocybe rancida]|nr:hypothetical protein DXG01_003996 [Tephrocybe rancida]
MTQPIKFYDIPSTIPGKSWSPNIWKTRYSLNFKGLPFETVWVEYPDIASLSKEMGFLPTPRADSDNPYYSLPAIYDPNTSTPLSESALIAQYLDRAYPNTPKLFPPGSHALQYAFIDALRSKLDFVRSFSLPASHAILNPVSQEYFRRTREIYFGATLEEVLPKGETGVAEWAKVKAGFDVVNGWLELGKSDGPYLLGQEPGFADFVLAGYVIYLKKIWGVDSQQWKDISAWNGGRWAKLVQDFEKYEGSL